MKLEFRNLKAEEIDCRPALINEKGLSLLLYKDARVDQDILDETVGPMNWQRKHSRDNANCEVGIWDEDKKQWVWKEDTGTESNTEKEKGLASDSFKRACFNWGIGRELYTSPFIWLGSNIVKIEKKEYQGKETYTTKEKFHVSAIKIENKEITKLSICNNQGIVVFRYNNSNNMIDSTKVESIKLAIKNAGLKDDDVRWTLEDYGYEAIEQITIADFKVVCDALKRLKEA